MPRSESGIPVRARRDYARPMLSRPIGQKGGPQFRVAPAPLVAVSVPNVISARAAWREPRRRVLVALSWWEDRIVAGIARFAAERDWVLDCTLRLRQRAPQLARGPFDGVIAYSGVSETNEELADYVRRSGQPVVNLHADRNILGAPVVAIEHEALGAKGAEHLLTLQLEHFAFVSFGDNPIESRRAAGFAAAILAAGKTLHRLTREEFEERLPLLPRPMGLMAANDVNAMDLVSLCLGHGRRVPEDFAIVGVDNSDVCTRISPVPLTSVACDFERQGYEAALMLQRQMDGLPLLEKRVAIPPLGVVVRRSTDTIAIADEETAYALRFLREHHSEPIRIKELADRLQGSLRRVQALFRQQTGRTMAQELMRLRLDHAKRLLADPRPKIEAVAQASGFANRFHLNQAFRRALGCTPSGFRAQLTRTESAKSEFCYEGGAGHRTTAHRPRAA